MGGREVEGVSAIEIMSNLDMTSKEVKCQTDKGAPNMVIKDLCIGMLHKMILLSKVMVPRGKVKEEIPCQWAI